MLGSNEIGIENIIDKIVFLTGNPRELYEGKSRFDLAWDLKIAKIQTGM